MTLYYKRAFELSFRATPTLWSIISDVMLDPTLDSGTVAMGRLGLKLG